MTAPKQDIPAWVADAIETRTGAELRLSGDRAIPARCTRCGAWTLHGYDAPRMATLAVVDPFLATATDEAVAVVLEQPTWRLWGNAGRWSLTDRHHPGVTPPCRYPSADDVRVVIAHHCGRPPIASTPLPRPGRHTVTERIPF